VVAQRLAADRAREIKAILVVQIDTASGVVNDLPAIHRAITTVEHPALLMVDCAASLGCMPFEMDAWGVDVAMAGSHWDWTFRQGEAHYQKYGGTPPEHLLFGLRKALDMLLEEGLDAGGRKGRPWP